MSDKTLVIWKVINKDSDVENIFEFIKNKIDKYEDIVFVSKNITEDLFKEVIDEDVILNLLTNNTSYIEISKNVIVRDYEIYNMNFIDELVFSIFELNDIRSITIESFMNLFLNIIESTKDGSYVNKNKFLKSTDTFCREKENTLLEKIMQSTDKEIKILNTYLENPNPDFIEKCLEIKYYDTITEVWRNDVRLMPRRCKNHK